MIVQDSNYDTSSSSAVYSDPYHHRIIVEAGSDKVDQEFDHYAIFIYNTEDHTSKRLTPDSLHSDDVHWVEPKERFYFRGYSNADLRAARAISYTTEVNWTMYSIKPDGSDLKAEFTRNKLTKPALLPK
jgi:hypothetical protein